MRSLSAMDFNPELFVQPVKGTDDTFAFQFGFGVAPEGKATETPVLDTDSVTELEDGDLLIEGWAANFEGIDRQGENFTDGAFKRGIKSFLSAGGPLCYHHDHKLGIGKVLDLDEVEGKGLRMRARVDKQEPTSPLYHIYNAVRKGTYKGLSVGGFFKRKLTEAGMKIADMDFTEISITPTPVHTGTSFAVIAGKALESEAAPATEEPETPDEALVELNRAVEAATSFVNALEAKALPANHKPGVAQDLRNFLDSLARTRSAATQLRQYGEVVQDLDDNTKPEETLGALADDVESALVKFESDTHKLAAKYGPLPPPVENGSDL